MPSLNIKDYIIAALLVVIIGCGITMFFGKIKIERLESYKETASALAAAQKQKIELLKLNSKKTEEYLNEKYEVELSGLNNTIKRLRNNRASLMPSVPEASSNPGEACFKREELASAIERYRREVQELVRKGAEGVLESNICKEWIEQEQKIYEIESGSN
jgi:hypothetical protein